MKINESDPAKYGGFGDVLEYLEHENSRLKAEIDRLTAMVGKAKVLSYENVTENGWYWWRAEESGPWSIVDVRDELSMQGEYLGPLPVPEV